VIWGLSYLDFGILIAFLVIILAIGIHASRSVKGEHDFYLGGRKMGKTLQFFLNFGNATDTNAAPTMAGQIYREGASGMWLQLQTLFFTPFFWFTQPWFRRARVITMADLFLDRFNSKAVASAYAMFNIMVALLVLGLGNLAGYSVVDAMLVKPYEQITDVQQKSSVDGYRALSELRKRDAATLSAEETQSMALLVEREKKGELREHIGAISKLEFYLGYNLIVAVYIMLGGLKAAAITDAVQGILILFMSVVLLPIGLYKIGGFSGLHNLVPDTAFWLSGTPFSSFTWYSIAAVTFGSFIQIIGLQHNMASGGSAKDENTARFGMLTGGFTKRLVLICWMLCGLLAVAIFSGNFDGQPKLVKSDLAWGQLSSYLLPVGLIGLMLSGMLLGHMPSVGMTSVAVSGLVVRNIYEFLVPGKSAKHYLRAGQAMIFVVLFASVAIAWFATDLGSLTALMITFNVFFGAVVFLLFFWRRLTVPAILVGFVVWLVIQIVIPITVAVSPLHSHESLLLETNAYQRTLMMPATDADVAAGKADVKGKLIPVNVNVPPSPVFFEKAVALKDVRNPSLGREGTGRFVVENAILYYPLRIVGLDMKNFSKADLTTSRWLFDGLFPFFILILVSLATPPTAPERAPAFYAKQKTPVAPTPELDHEEIEKNKENPSRWEHTKLFPNSNWEFGKWTREDFLGFFGCYALVLVILGILWFVLHVGKPGSWF
jgi:Na+/proline symporter